MTLEHRINKVLRRVKDPKKRKALKEGIKTEAEHSKTIRWIRANPEASVDEALKRIAQDHIEEDPAYYEKLAVVEGKVKRQKGLKPPRLKLLGGHGRVKVYLVDATAVRKMTNINPAVPDFTMGSNGAVWPRPVGRDEIWISDELGPPRDPLELRLTWIHEALEMRRMQRDGLDYDAAHDESLAVEEKYRKIHGRGLVAAIRRLRGWRVLSSALVTILLAGVASCAVVSPHIDGEVGWPPRSQSLADKTFVNPSFTAPWNEISAADVPPKVLEKFRERHPEASGDATQPQGGKRRHAEVGHLAAQVNYLLKK